jgi:hypothetical protein
VASPSYDIYQDNQIKVDLDESEEQNDNIHRLLGYNDIEVKSVPYDQFMQYDGKSPSFGPGSQP